MQRKSVNSAHPVLCHRILSALFTHPKRRPAPFFIHILCQKRRLVWVSATPEILERDPGMGHEFGLTAHSALDRRVIFLELIIRCPVQIRSKCNVAGSTGPADYGAI